MGEPAPRLHLRAVSNNVPGRQSPRYSRAARIRCDRPILVARVSGRFPSHHTEADRDLAVDHVLASLQRDEAIGRAYNIFGESTRWK